MRSNRKRLNLRTKKKASIILDSISFITVLTAMAFITIVGYYFIDDVYDASVDIMNESSNTSLEILERTHTEYPPIWDGIMGFLVFGLWITAIVSSFFLDSQPLFFIVSLILLSTILLVAMVMSNSYFELVNDEAFVDTASNFPITNFIMFNLPYLALAIYFTIGVSMFAKSSL